jgi:cytochrome c553
MKLIRLKPSIPAILCCSTLAFASYADQLPVRNCTWCHGASAQGSTPAPRLAGQQPQYLKNQLINFRKHTREAPFSKQYMWGAAANLSPGTARDLAAYFSGLPAQPADDGERQLVPLGRTIYQDGIADDNIAACAACHGPDAQGIGEIPRWEGWPIPI